MIDQMNRTKLIPHRYYATDLPFRKSYSTIRSSEDRALHVPGNQFGGGRTSFNVEPSAVAKRETVVKEGMFPPASIRLMVDWTIPLSFSNLGWLQPLSTRSVLIRSAIQHPMALSNDVGSRSLEPLARCLPIVSQVRPFFPVFKEIGMSNVQNLHQLHELNYIWRVFSAFPIADGALVHFDKIGQFFLAPPLPFPEVLYALPQLL